jgi:sulfur carrier protein ThiS
MRITLKLYATLGRYLPDDAEKNIVRPELPDDTSVTAVIERFRLPPELVHLVLVNGVFVAPEQRAGTHLKDGDVLAIWPPVAGG